MGNPAVVVIIFVLVVAVGVALWRKYLPDAACRWCKGTGNRWGSNSRKRSGPCFFCEGSGKRKGKSR